MATPHPLDLPTLRTLVDLDDGTTGLLEEMLEIFEADTPRRIQAVVDAVAAGDAEAFSEAAHTLKGGAGAMGAEDMRLQAAHLEALGRKGAVDQDPDLEARLTDSFQVALAALKAHLAQVKGQGAP